MYSLEVVYVEGDDVFLRSGACRGNDVFLRSGVCRGK